MDLLNETGESCLSNHFIVDSKQGLTKSTHEPLPSAKFLGSVGLGPNGGTCKKPMVIEESN